MVPIVVYWTNYTATVQGRVAKLVPCENCRTEYVYVLEREGVGAGACVYGISVHGLNEDPADHAVAGAREGLQQYLENDFDPVPCPTCGHYQRFMFAKLMETRSLWPVLATMATLAVVLMSLISAVYWGINYLGQPSDHALLRLGVAASVLTVAGLIAARLSAVQRNRPRNFF